MSWLRTLPAGKIQAVYRDREGRQRSQAFATKRDAREFLRQVDAEMRGGTWVDPKLSRTLFRDLAERWWAARVRAVQLMLGHSKPETTARYTLVPEGSGGSPVLPVP